MMSLLSRTHPEWKKLLLKVFSGELGGSLTQLLADEYQREICYPKREDIFNAFMYCGPNDIKVVCIGQDPYINDNQANGLAFSVKQGVRHPPSLMNIIEELNNDLSTHPDLIRKNGCLEYWAKQGVLLMNSHLTVRAGASLSHEDLGWEKFTDDIIKELSKANPKIVYLLWGNFAKSKKPLIANSLAVLEAPHPSPLSAHRGWFGCKHFSKTNEILSSHGLGKIDWIGNEPS